jgi:hypothetical protein
MKLGLLITFLAAAAAGLGLALSWTSVEPHGSPTVRPSGGGFVSERQEPQNDSAAGRLERELHVKPGSKRHVGEFALRQGKSLMLTTAATTDGHWCLIDVVEPSGGAGSTCHEGAAFGRSKVVFSINMDGGPDRFAELYLLGVAAPDVHAIVLAHTDGTTVVTEPTAEGGFAFESTAADLEARIYPTTLRLYGQGRQLVETVDLPAIG